jgi:hypothetical protein
MALHLNPLTAGTLLDGGVLSLRSFAPARSYRPFSVSEATHPEDFAALLGWLQGSGGDEWLPSDPILRASAMVSGVLVSDDELAALPGGVAPELGSGHAAAAAFCPDVLAVLAADPVFPELPAALGEGLDRRGYAELPALFDDAALAALADYYAALAEGGLMRFDRGQSGRRVINNDPVGRHLLAALTPLIGELARAALKPSYCFAARYGPGDELARHTDRSQCEYTVSLFIDHQPAGSDARCPWPLFIHSPDGDIEVRQARGGGPVFRGRELPHSRPPLGAGESSQMLFLHYVHADFADSLD